MGAHPETHLSTVGGRGRTGSSAVRWRPAADPPGSRALSTYLGQFTDESADAIAEAFDEAGVGWSAKTSGRFTRVIFAGDWGVRLFVDDDQDLDRAWDIAGRIAPDGLARRPG